MYQIKHKITIGLFLFLASINPIFSQQIPLSSGYIFNIFQINPAYTGFRDGLQVTSMFRKQWTGIQNSPQTNYIGLDMPIPNKRAGLGLQFIDAREDISKTFGAQLSYSYKIQVGENSNLSMGLQSGLFDYSIDYSMVDIIDANDPWFSQALNRTKLNFGGGLFYSAPKFYLGLSSSNFIRNNPNSSEMANANAITQNVQAYLHSGYIFTLSGSLHFIARSTR